MRWNEKNLDSMTQFASALALLTYVLGLFALGLLQTVQALICDLQIRMLSLRTAECLNLTSLGERSELLVVFVLLLLPAVLVHGFVKWHRHPLIPRRGH